MTEINLYNKDCLDFLNTLENESVDLIITSPPYNIGSMHSNSTQYGSYANNDMKECDYQEWQIRVMNELYRILRNDGSLFYNHKVRISKGIGIHPLEWILKTNFLLKQEITWNQRKSANCDKIRFFPFSERIYWLVKDRKTKVYNINNLSDVWDVVPTHKRSNIGHIAVMPEKIVENILGSIPSLEEKVVLDPFLGSGTTGVVSKRFDVKEFIGIELEKEYFDIASTRIKESE